jgi:hypothetical protein
MTLAALKGMNVNMGDLANSFKPKAADPVDLAAKHEREKAAAAARSAAEAATAAELAAKKERRSGKPAAKASAGLVDPMQLWGALTQQFQQIAATAMKDVAKHTAADAVSNPAAGAAKPAAKATKKVANNAAATRAAARKVIKKPATRSR